VVVKTFDQPHDQRRIIITISQWVTQFFNFQRMNVKTWTQAKGWAANDLRELEEIVNLSSVKAGYRRKR